MAHEDKYWWERLESRSECEQRLEISVPRQAGKTARTAILSVRYDQVTLKAPAYRQAEKLPNREVYAVLAREESPPLGEEAVEWLRLSTLAVNRFEEAIERIEWYTGRWVIEIYHQVLKIGGKIEGRQVEKTERLECYLAIDRVVAWRILGRTCPSRETPKMSGEAFLERKEWPAWYGFTKQNTPAPKQPLTLREAARWIAKLGGFLGRKPDGHPGVTVMWRGFQRLADIVVTWWVFNHSRDRVN